MNTRQPQSTDILNEVYELIHSYVSNIFENPVVHFLFLDYIKTIVNNNDESVFDVANIINFIILYSFVLFNIPSNPETDEIYSDTELFDPSINDNVLINTPVETELSRSITNSIFFISSYIRSAFHFADFHLSQMELCYEFNNRDMSWAPPRLDDFQTNEDNEINNIPAFDSSDHLLGGIPMYNRALNPPMRRIVNQTADSIQTNISSSLIDRVSSSFSWFQQFFASYLRSSNNSSTSSFTHAQNNHLAITAYNEQSTIENQKIVDALGLSNYIIPNDVICPITQLIINEIPVFVIGHKTHWYDKNGILAWLTCNNSNPIDRTTLNETMLCEDLPKKYQIDVLIAYLTKHADDLRNMDSNTAKNNVADFWDETKKKFDSLESPTQDDLITLAININNFIDSSESLISRAIVPVYKNPTPYRLNHPNTLFGANYWLINHLNQFLVNNNKQITATYVEQQEEINHFIEENGNAYTILNIEQNANGQEIKKAYRELAIESHPDKNNLAVISFYILTAARDILLNETKRKIHDNYLNNNSVNHVKTADNPRKLSF